MLLQGFKIFFFVLGGIYLLYLVYLLIRAYAELRQMPYFGECLIPFSPAADSYNSVRLG